MGRRITPGVMFVCALAVTPPSLTAQSAGTDASDRGPGPGFELLQNYPNPFNPATTIRYDLPAASRVSLEVFDILGRRVSVMVNEEQRPGRHTAIFDGSRYASGVYLYRIVAVPLDGQPAGATGAYPGVFMETRSFTLVK
jgi:hypothetical protein